MTSVDKKFNKFELKPDSRFYRTFQEENFIKKFPDVSWLGMHPVISFFNATGVNLRTVFKYLCEHVGKYSCSLELILKELQQKPK